MKYFVKLLWVILIMMPLALVIQASDSTSNVYTYTEQNVTVEFQSDTSFSEATCQAIADAIVYNTPLPQTYSLCWLIGHDTTVERVSAIYHERSYYDPRCQWEIYDVIKCSKCDYINPSLISSKYISCCPPEASAVSLD